MPGTFVRECLAFDAKNLGNIGNAIGARYRVEVDCFFIVSHDVCIYYTRPKVSSNFTTIGGKQVDSQTTRRTERYMYRAVQKSKILWGFSGQFH